MNYDSVTGTFSLKNHKNAVGPQRELSVHAMCLAIYHLLTFIAEIATILFTTVANQVSSHAKRHKNAGNHSDIAQMASRHTAGGSGVHDMVHMDNQHQPVCRPPGPSQHLCSCCEWWALQFCQVSHFDNFAGHDGACRGGQLISWGGQLI
jgi:hypothetical protein